jgi:mRNA-degrading endonuclease YafQ of YafQ-DinJ toxin-antitoxin module
LEALNSLRDIANVSKIKKDFDKILSESPMDEKKLMPLLSLLLA